MPVSRQRSDPALAWAARSLSARTPREALWWLTKAYQAAPTAPAIRATVRRVRRRFPNARGRPPVRWPLWAAGLVSAYGLLTLAALGLILWSLRPPAANSIPMAATAERPVLPSPTPKALSASAESVDSTPPRPSPAPSPSAPTPRPTLPTPRRTLEGPPFPGRWIRVDLSDQELVAYEGKRPVLRTLVSTGRPQTPTVLGTYRIYLKLRSQTMTGPGYRLPHVPYVMYFYKGYALHGTYWHNNFGRPMSHGCVNLPTPIAEQLYHWAEIGTPVVIQP